LRPLNSLLILFMCAGGRHNRESTQSFTQ
jgi:hypothetical protein